MTDKLLLSESAIPKASAPPLAPTKAMMYPAFASAPTAPEAANHLPTEHTPVARPVVHGPPPQQQQQQPVLMATSPSPFIVNMLPKGKWSSGLLTGCLGDPGGCHGCLYSCLCPCMAFGDIVGRMDSSESMVGGSWWGGCCAHFWLGGCVTQWNIFFCNLMMWATCSHLVHVPVRTAIRHRYGIPGSELGDCCDVFWCEPCALTQERKELILRDRAARQVTAVASIVSVPNANNAMYSHGSPNADTGRPRSGGSERGLRKVAPDA